MSARDDLAVEEFKQLLVAYGWHITRSNLPRNAGRSAWMGIKPTGDESYITTHAVVFPADFLPPAFELTAAVRDRENSMIMKQTVYDMPVARAEKLLPLAEVRCHAFIDWVLNFDTH